MEALGEQQLNELAEKWLGILWVQDPDLSNPQNLKVIFGMAIREAHELGRTQGLEEAAKFCRRVQNGEFDHLSAPTEVIIISGICSLANKNPVE